MRMRRTSTLALLLLVGGLVAVAPLSAAAGMLPSGERSIGHATIEPAYDDMTGGLVYLLTPDHLAPLSATNVINGVNQHAAAPLYLIVYPPGTNPAWTLNCMGVPGNCPDHAPTIASLATSVMPGTYGSNPSLVPGHDHLVGVAATGGDFNAPWHVYVELFTSQAAVTHITTLAQLRQAWVSGAIDPTASGQGVDTGITFVCAVVSSATYRAGKPVS